MFNTTVKAILLKDGIEATHTCHVETETIGEGIDALDSFGIAIGLDDDYEDNVLQIHYTVVRISA